jgi:hypothetical protein
VPDERITWIDCPTCGDRAAVGWQIDRGPDGALREAPTTFDCTSGCTMTHLQVVYWFGGRGTGRAGARLG